MVYKKMKLNKVFTKEHLPFVGFRQAASELLDRLEKRHPVEQWMLVRLESGQTTVLDVRGVAPFVEPGKVRPYKNTLVSLVLEHGLPLMESNIASDSVLQKASAVQLHGVAAYLCAPLLSSRREPIGWIIGLSRVSREDFSQENLSNLMLYSRVLSTFLEHELTAVENARRLERAENEAMRDGLTRLYNRRGWERFIEKEDIRAGLYGGATGVIIVDVDNLKTVNDTHGHAAGDKLLQRVARVLEKSLRTSDIIARLGGDEFGVLAINATSEELKLLSKRLQLALDSADLSASVGSCPGNSRRPLHQTINTADGRMYENKRQRKLALPSLN